MWRCWSLPSAYRLALAPRVSVYIASDRGVKGTERSWHTGESTTKAQGDKLTDDWQLSWCEKHNSFRGWKELPSSKIHYLRGLWSGELFTDEILKLASSVAKMCPVDPLLIFQFSSVTQSCPTLCDPMNRSMPGFPVHHQLPEFTQTIFLGDSI